MYKDVMKRVLASVLAVCMIGSTPNVELLAGGGGGSTAKTHSYANTMGDLSWRELGETGSIANVYTVKPNEDADANAQTLQTVSFALDYEYHLGDVTEYVSTADYTVNVYVYSDGSAENAMKQTPTATESGQYRTDADALTDGYYTVDVSKHNVLLGNGDKFIVEVELSGAQLVDDAGKPITEKIIRYQQAIDEVDTDISYVNGKIQNGYTACITATTLETVKEEPITGLDFAETGLEMLIGEKKTIDVVYIPTYTSQKDLRWSSTNEGVATVNASTGEVTAVAAGKTEIKATSVSNPSLNAVTDVTVCKDIKNVSDIVIAEQTYTGAQIRPTFSVYDGETKLEESDQYTIEYGTNTDVATGGTIKVNGSGNGYLGEKEIPFVIVAAPMNDGKVVATCKRNYGLKEDETEFTLEDLIGVELSKDLTPEEREEKLQEELDKVFEVKYSPYTGLTNTLVYGKDYKITAISGTTQTGNTGYVELKGMGNYTGTLRCNLQIKKEISAKDIVVSLSPKSYTYNGNERIPTITVTDGTVELKEGRDYTVSIDDDGDLSTPSDLVSAGVKTITITGKGAYEAYEQKDDGTGNMVDDTTKPKTQTVTYEILKRNLSTVTMAELPNQLAKVTADTIEGLKLTYNNKTLVKDTDYTVSVATETDGSVTISITGIENYQGSITKNVQTGKDIKNCTVDMDSVYYTGIEVEPQITLKDGIDTVGADNYTLRWQNNINVGTATVYISGVGAYAGELRYTFEILPRDISEATITYDTSVPYNKNGAISDVVVKYNGRVLTEGTHYTVNCSDNTAVTTPASAVPDKATVTITGMGNFGGNVVKNYEVEYGDIADLQTVTYSGIASEGYPYKGSPVEPVITIRQDGTPLVKDVDYTIDYNYNDKVGTAEIFVTGIGNYDNSYYLIQFEITKVGIAGADIVPLADETYDGTAKEPALVVTVDSVVLTKGIDYDVIYSNNIEAGEATAKIQGKGNYFGETEAKFRIIKDINDATIEVKDIASQYWTGKAVTPEVTILDKYVDTAVYTLQENTDYTLVYADNTGAGDATVTITGKGYYTGTKAVDFKIVKGTLAATNSNVKVTLKNANPNARTFTGSEVNPEFVVTCKGNVLTLGTDYTVDYAYNVNAHTNINNNNPTTATIRGIGNFTGYRFEYYEILPKAIDDSSIEVTVNPIDAIELEENGYPVMEIVDNKRAAGGTAVAAGSGDYELKMGDTRDYILGEPKVNTDGTASIEIIGQNNYANSSLTVEFTVDRADIDDPSSNVKYASQLPLEQQSFEYTGRVPEIKPVVTRRADGGSAVILTEGTDYTIEVPDSAKNVGTHKYQIHFMGAYTGTMESTDSFTVTAKDISSSDVTMDAIGNQPYTGSAVTPAVTLHFNNEVLSSDNYDVQYTNNVDKGIATATIKGKGNFKGIRTVTFEIKQLVLMSETKVTVTGTYTYTTKAITPSGSNVKVTYGTATLVEGRDYTLSYENNIKANDNGQPGGKAYVIVKGTGETYGGETKAEFTISRKNMADKDINVSVENTAYTGSQVVPVVTITYTLPSGEQVVLGKDDYGVNVQNATEVSTKAEARILPTGFNFYYSGADGSTGEFVKYFTIFQKPLVDSDDVLLPEYNIPQIAPIRYVAEQKKYEPKVTITDKSRTAGGAYNASGNAPYYTLIDGVDYSITYSGNTRPGTAHYTIKCKGNYSGTYTGDFTILADISEATVQMDSQVYTGKPIEPAFKVFLGDLKLEAGKDFEYVFRNNTNATKEAELVIHGINDYVGANDLVWKFEIAPKSIEDKEVEKKHIYGSYTFKGENINVYPEPHLYYNGVRLDDNKDFVCTFAEECWRAGKDYWYDFKIEGKGNYTGVYTGTYRIGDNYTSETVNVNVPEKSFVYTGKAHYPAFNVTLVSDPSVRLEPNKDYEYEYENNIDVGTAYINTWGGPKNSIYAGDVSVSFEITPMSLADDAIIMADVPNQTYAGEAITPKPIVTWDGKELIENEDFVYEYSNNTAASVNSGAGTATVTIRGIGNFKDTKSVEFKILRKNIAQIGSDVVVEDIKDQIYTGSAITPKPMVTWGEMILEQDVDYRITSYENNTGLGEASLTIEGIGNYEGTVKKNFRIVKVPMERMTFKYTDVWTYTGNSIEPPVEVSYADADGNKIVIDSSEYQVTYANTIDAGADGEATGKITIAFTGNYEGTKNCTYTIKKRNLSDATITMDKIPNQVLDATNKAEPKPVLIFRPDSNTTYTLVEGADYTLSYTGNTGVGTEGTVTVTGLHNFTGSLSRKFYIGKDLKQYIDRIEFVEEPDYTYNGKAQTPKVRVILKTGQAADLVEGRDYEILYDGQKKEDITDDAYATKAGMHKVNVSGLEPYGGGIERTYEIKKRNLDKVKFTAEAQPFTGSEIHPLIIGTDTEANTRLGETGVTADISKDGMLINQNAFTTEIKGNATELGTVSVTITAEENSNYTGTTTASFEIVAMDLQNQLIASSTVENQKYTASAVKPGILLTDYRRNKEGKVYDPAVDTEYYTLVEGTDYDITYSENIYPGTVVMTINGKGHYTNTLAKQFEIVADLADAQIAPIPAQQYKGGEPVKPELTVTLGERKLNENFDYTVTYSNNTERGTATATIYPVAGSMFTGSQTVTFEISREFAMKEFRIGMIDTSFTYTGSPITPAVAVLTTEGTALTEGTDYTVSYENNVNVGTAKVRVTGKGLYTGTIVGYFTIVKRSVIRCTFSEVESALYTGSPITRSIVVKDGNRILKEQQDYTVAYVNNTNPGIATMTISGKGNYGGMKTIRYLIHVQHMTAVTAKAATKSVKLSWTKVPGAGGYAIYDNNGKLISKTTSTTYTHENLGSMKRYTYKVRPYMISDGATYYGETYETVSTVTKPSKPSVKVRAGKSKIKISWKKIKGVSGYEVYRSTKKNGKYKKIKTLKKASKTSYTNKNLKSNVKYYYKVRAYKKIDGKKYYSNYSKVKSKKAK